MVASAASLNTFFSFDPVLSHLRMGCLGDVAGGLRSERRRDWAGAWRNEGKGLEDSGHHFSLVSTKVRMGKLLL